MDTNDYGIRSFFFFKRRIWIIIQLDAAHLASYFQINGKHLQEQYKEHISDYGTWEQKHHVENWMLFTGNLSSKLSIDETALSNGTLYTFVANKEAGRLKGCHCCNYQGHNGFRL